MNENIRINTLYKLSQKLIKTINKRSHQLQLQIIVVYWRQVQIHPKNPDLTAIRFLQHGGGSGGAPVAPHMATQRLSNRKLKPTNWTLVGPGLGRRRPERIENFRAVNVHELGLPVAGPVPSQRLERREFPLTSLANENLAVAGIRRRR